MANQNFRASQEGSRTAFQIGASGGAPRFGAQPRTQIGLPSAPTSQAPRRLNFSQIEQVLQGYQRDALAQQQEQQQQEASEAAAQAQTEMGSAGIAQPDSSLNRTQRTAWKKTTTAIYDQQIRTAANKKAAELALQNQGNPDAFDAAWQAWSEETLSQISQGDARVGAQAQAYIDQVGSRSSIALLEQQHTTIANEQKTQATVALREMQAAAANNVRANPTEQVLAEQLADLRLNLAEMADANLLRGAEIAQLEQEASVDLTRNFVVGQSNQAFADNDFDRVQMLVDDLRTGRHFQDNRLGDQLANQLESTAGAMKNEVNGTIVARERARLGEAEAIMEQMLAGVPITPEQEQQLDGIWSELTHSIDPDVQAGADSLHAGIAAFEYINENINTMSVEELQATLQRTLSAESFSLLPPRAQSAVTTRINNELTRISEALGGANPDVAHAGRVDVANASFFDLEPEAVLESRQLAASRTNRPLETTPYFTNEQVTEVSNSLKEAARAGDTNQFNSIAERYLQFYAPSQSESAGVRLLGDIDPEMGGIALLAFELQESGIANASAFANTAVNGIAVDQGFSIGMNDLPPRAREQLMALSETHGMKMNMVLQGLSAYGKGLAVVDPESSVASSRAATATAVSDLLENLPVTELSNGMRIMTRELGATPEVRNARREAIESVLSDPAVSQAYDVDQYRPVPMPDGAYQFRHKSLGVFMREPGDEATPVTARVGEAVFVEAKRADLEQLALQEQSAFEASINALALTERPKVQFASAASQLNIPQEDAMGLFRAISLSPARSMHRMVGGVAPEVLSEAPNVDEFYFGSGVLQDKSRLTPEMRVASDVIDSIVSPERLQDEQSPEAETELAVRQAAFGNVSPQDEGRIATLVLFSGFLDRFGDRRQALAAVHAGEDELTDAIEIGGEAWLDVMEEDTRAFVMKGMRQ